MKISFLSLAILATAGLAGSAIAADTAPATQPASRSGVPAASSPAQIGSGGDAASTPPPASLELLGSVQRSLRTVESIEASFTQEKHLLILKHTLTIRGHFALQKPDRVIWIVKEPVRYAIRVQGEEVRQWDEDTNKVQIIHLGGDPTFKAISEQIDAWFLGDYKALGQSYDAFVLGDKPLSLRFVPKGGTMIAKIVRNIDLTFGKDNMNIEKMLIREAAGDWTALTFIDSRLNQPIKKEIWEIPPK